jgi:hypothetical protein
MAVSDLGSEPISERDLASERMATGWCGVARTVRR